MPHLARHAGYVLPITLVLLMIATVALGGLTRRSMSTALAAVAGEDDLQRRWGMRSLETAVLPHAERLLMPEEDGGLEVDLSSRGYTCRLGGMRFNLILRDEQARVNVNKLIELSDRVQTQQAVRLATLGSAKRSERTAEIRLRPYPLNGGRVDSFGQVFDKPSGIELSGIDRVESDAAVATAYGYGSSTTPGGGASGGGGSGGSGGGLAEEITCWGDGRLTWRRASEETLGMLLRPVIGSANGIAADLVEARADDPEIGPGEALAQITGLTDGQRQRISALLTDRSRAHGLWIVAACGHRLWHRFIVTEAPDDAPPRTLRFNW